MYANPIDSPINATSSLPFSPIMQHQTIATLLLIENSQAMSFIWADLRDRYLPSLVTKLGSVDPAFSNKTIVLESLPLQNTEFSPVPLSHDALQNSLCDVRFNYDPCNRLSAGKIWSVVDFLASAKFQGQPAVRHLIVVAASTPQDDGIRVNVHSKDELSPWQSLAHTLAQADIQCHVALGINEDMGPLMTLFEETLRLQNFVEELPSFPVDRSKILFRLSGRPHNLYSVPGPYPVKSAEHIIPHRHHTFPTDPYIPTSCTKDEEIFASSASSTENPPSLVTQLQQVHGLTKKKVYGTKAVRQPFFREERVRDRYRKGATPVSVSATATHLSSATNGGGRAITRSRAERLARGSPTESHSRHPGLNRKMSAPDAESLASPTSFSRPSSMSSPILPTPVDIPMQPATLLSSEAINPSDHPTWLQNSSIVPSLLQTGDYPGNRWHGDHNSGGAYPQHPVTAEAPIIPSFIPSTIPKQRRRELGLTRNNEASNRPTRSARAVRPEDEEPFVFNDEYVAQTVALFENEVLPAYPNFAAMGEPLPQSATPSPLMNSTSPPSRSFYITPDQESQPSSPSSYNPRDAYASSHQNQNQMGLPSLSFDYNTVDSPLTYATTYSPGSNSSLTGWAG